MIRASPIAISHARAARLALIGVALLLAACETTPEVMPVDDPERVWAEHQARLAAIDQWAAVGKLGIQSTEDSWTAGLNWLQDRDSFTIRLSGPLGQGLMELRGSGRIVEMRTANDGVYRATTAEELMQTHAGWQVPLSGLRHWILGRPDPRARIVELALDAGGRLAELRQLDWHIRYGRYAEFDGVVLPTRLTLENTRLRAKLVVRSWRTGPDST
ncbi:MAG: outer membrane lipoprotein LolB [Gammaproteobacteria bacterium]|nr:outer membrane lipoprotein LolB [Gammaproteobacteria bacterium]